MTPYLLTEWLLLPAIGLLGIAELILGNRYSATALAVVAMLYIAALANGL